MPYWLNGSYCKFKKFCINVKILFCLKVINCKIVFFQKALSIVPEMYLGVWSGRVAKYSHPQDFLLITIQC